MARARNGGWQADFTHDGKRYRCDGWRTEEAALAWEYLARSNLLLGKPLPPGPPINARAAWTLREMLKYAYEVHWAKLANPEFFLKYTKVLCDDLGPNHPAADLAGSAGYAKLEAACTARGNSGATINKKASVLSKALKIAIDDGKLTGIAKPQFKRQPESVGREYCLTAEEEASQLALLRQWDPDVADWYVTCIDTGMRVYSEALNVYPHVDIRGSLLVIRGRSLRAAANITELHTARRTKTGHSRTITMTARVREIVERRQPKLAEDGRLFDKTKVSQPYVRNIWDRMRTVLKITHPDIVPYCLRHTNLTRLIAAGVPVPHVTDWAGHSTPAQTWKYVHLAGTMSAAAASNLEEFLKR